MTAARLLCGKRCVVWLAAYPKSGSTWLRLLLANFVQLGRSVEAAPVAINEVRAALPSSSTANREHFDEFTGLPSADCTDAEAERLRPAVYRAHAERHAGAGTPFFYHTHDAYLATPAGEPLFPDDVSVGAVHLVRDPLDVAVSWAYYSGHENMAASVAMLGYARARLESADWPRLQQRLLDWSGHAESWRKAPFPLLTVRYEDMLANAAGELGRVARFLRLEGADDQARLQQAAAFSDFAGLRRAEQREGFKEKPAWARRFFRAGRTGDGRRRLSAEQVRSVVRAHGRTMATLGYR